MALNQAGVGLTRISEHLAMAPTQVTELLLGYRVGELVRLGRRAGVDLVQDVPGRCLISGCANALDVRRLCNTHYFRLCTGRPLLAPVHGRAPRIAGCAHCEARWCQIKGDPPRTCGSPACAAAEAARLLDVRSAAAKKRARRVAAGYAERNEQILARVRAGEPYPVIADDVGLSPMRISQLAIAAGIYRYSARSPGRRAARQRREVLGLS